MSRVATAVTVARTVLADAKTNRITFLAAAVAYYGFVSIVPLLLLAVAVVSVVGGELAGTVVGITSGFLTESGQTLVRNALENAAGRRSATVASLLLLLWSGLRLFRGLDTAFSEVYGVVGVESLPQQLRDALLVLVSIGAALVAAASIGVVAPLLAVIPFESVVSFVLLLAALTLAFLPVYYIFPDVELEVREVLPGTVFAAVGWTVLTELFRIYTGYVDDYQVYGLLGAAILLVTWMYLSGIVIMIGAELNAVLAGRTEEDGADAREEAERPEAAPDVTELAGEVRSLRRELDRKTVSRADLEAELKEYVRDRMRKGHARGWGPYLVLLYGTAMTVGAFYLFRSDWAAIFAMVVVWLSTLGLYVVMLAVGAGISAASLPGKAVEWAQSRSRDS